MAALHTAEGSRLCIALPSGQDASIRFVRDPEVGVKASAWEHRLGKHETLALPTPVSDDLAKVALRQAEERTHLSVECASLLKRLEKLDQEMAQLSEWRRYPESAHEQSLQMRLEDARQQTARRQQVALSNYSSKTVARPLSAAMDRVVACRLKLTKPNDSDEKRLSVEHLRNAQSCAENEALAWRQRACSITYGAEQERERARQLAGFVFDSALQNAEFERDRLTHTVQDQAASIEMLQTQLRAATAVNESTRVAMDTAVSRANLQHHGQEEQRAICQDLERAIAAKDRLLASTRRELEAHREESQVKLRELSAAVVKAEAAAKRELEMTRKELEQSRIESETRVLRHNNDVAVLHAQLHRARAELEASNEDLEMARADGESRSQRHMTEVVLLQSERETHVRELQDDNGRLNLELSSRGSELDAVRKELVKTLADTEARKAEASRLGEALTTVNTSMSLLQQQLAEARDTAEVHKKQVKRLQDELHEAGKGNLTRVAHLGRLQEELSKCQKDCEGHTAHIGALQGELQLAKRERDLLKVDCEAHLNHIGRLQEDVLALREARDLAQKDGKGQLERVGRLQEELQSMCAERRKVQLDAESHLAHIGRLEAELEALRRDRQSALTDCQSHLVQMGRLQDEIDGLRGERDALQKDSQARLAQIGCLQEEVTSTRLERDSAKTDCKSHLAHIGRLQDDLVAARTQRDMAKSDCTQISRLQEELGRSKRDCESHLLHVGRLQKEIQEVREQLNAARTDCETHVARLEQIQQEVAVARDERDAAQLHVQRVATEKEESKAHLGRVQHELNEVKAERDDKVQAFTGALRRAELLAARCDTVEAALANANSKQADLVLEKEHHRTRSARLERLLTGEEADFMPCISATSSLQLTPHYASTRNGSRSSARGALLEGPRTRAIEDITVRTPNTPTLPPVSRPTSARSERRTTASPAEEREESISKDVRLRPTSLESMGDV